LTLSLSNNEKVRANQNEKEKNNGKFVLATAAAIMIIKTTAAMTTAAYGQI